MFIIAIYYWTGISASLIIATHSTQRENIMKNSKNYYRQFAYKGFKWGGWLADEQLHFFVAGDYQQGFKEVRCLESELTDKSKIDGKSSFQKLVDWGMTR